MHSMNTEMLEMVLEIIKTPDYLDKVKILCNQESDLIRPETAEDPTRRGQRKYKRAIRRIKLDLGEPDILPERMVAK